MKKPRRLGQGRCENWVGLLLSSQGAVAGQLPHAIAVALEHVLDGTEVHACHGFVEAGRERRLEETHQLEDGREVFSEEISPVVDESPQVLGLTRGENDRARGDRMQATVRAAAIIGARGVRHLGNVELDLFDEVEAIFELSTRQLVVALKSSKAPTNYFTPNILRKSWSRLVVSVVHLDALAFPVAAM